MEENRLKTYATAIYQNAMVGVQSIRDIEDSVEDLKLQKELDRERAGFNKIAQKVQDYATKNGFMVEENNFFEKSRMWLSVKMSTMFNNSTRHIAEMMLLGTVMGLTTCYKDKFDHKGVSEELDKILGELEKLEDDNYLKLKTFLKEM